MSCSEALCNALIEVAVGTMRRGRLAGQCVVRWTPAVRLPAGEARLAVPVVIDILKSPCLTCLNATLFLLGTTLKCDFLTPSPEYNEHGSVVGGTRHWLA